MLSKKILVLFGSTPLISKKEIAIKIFSELDILPSSGLKIKAFDFIFELASLLIEAIFC